MRLLAMNTEILRAEFLSLPPDEMAEFIREGMIKLGKADALDLLFQRPDPKDEDIEQYWLEVAAKRARKADQGKAKFIDGDEARRRIRESLRNCRAA